MNRLAHALTVMLALATGMAFCTEWQATAPAPRSLPTLVVDSANRRGVMFGGGTYDHFMNDVWELSPNPNAGYVWRRIQTSGTPPPGRAGHSAIYDPIGQRMVIFGGRDANSARSDIWALDLNTSSWRELHPAGEQPGPRVFHSAVYVPGRRSMIVFDGMNLSSAYDEVWELKLDTLKWCRLSIPGTHPSARWSYVLALDRGEDRLVTFGGQYANSMANDAWALDLTPGGEHWSQLSTSGNAPGPRSNSACCIDNTSRRLWVFGGFYYPPFTPYNELYCLDLASLAWDRIQVSGELPWERRCAAGLYDPANQNFIVFGGQGYETFFSDLCFVDVSTVGMKEWQSASPGQTGLALMAPTVTTRPVRFRYSLNQSGAACVRIMDEAGRTIRELFSGKAQSMNGSLVWDGKCDDGRLAPAGSYFCYLESGQTGVSRKFVLTE